jgi:hypothetical protein
MKSKKQPKSPKPLKLKKRKSQVRAEDAFLAKYTPEVIQSALDRNAKTHPPTYQCPRCKLKFKDLLAYAPHTRFFNIHQYCRSVKQITASRRFKQITYTDDFFLKEHTCIVLQNKEISDTDNEVTEEESKKTDVDRRIVLFNREDYEYRPLQSHWSEPDPHTGEVIRLHANEYYRYREAIDYQDEQRLLKKTERDLNLDEFISFKKMVTNWLDSQPSVMDCNYHSDCPYYIRVINSEFKLTPTEQSMHDEWVAWMKSQGIEVK